MQIAIIAAAIAALVVYFDSGKNQASYYKSAESCSAKLTTIPWTKRSEGEETETKL